jgi:hypothetical protein
MNEKELKKAIDEFRKTMMNKTIELLKKELRKEK